MEETVNLKESFLSFLKSSKKYINQLNSLINTNKRLFTIDLSDIHSYSSNLHLEIIKNYYINLEELKNTFLLFVSQHTNTSEWQLSFINTYLHKFRDLKSVKLGTLISFGGTVTRSSVVRPELVEGVFLCKLCNQKSKQISQQFKFTEPLYCLNKLCSNRKSWDLKMDESIFSNWQKVTVQESTTEIPPGALPRTIDVILRDELVESVKPGSNTVFTGTLIVVPEDLFLMLPQSKTVPLSSGNKNYLNVKGVNQKFVFLCSSVSQNELEIENECVSKVLFEKENISNFNDENKSVHSFLDVNEGVKGVYERMSESLFPNIFGHRSIKNAILLMLVGGVKKSKENIKLRGDINILLVGDPGTAKSQFLKQCSKIMDRSIYTSGKSSSAAGLTACVVKEEGEFTIEAGALMLSDNGYCCIDEFDKMNENDRVAIHEAMEQQTISISKAGINATLNAKCSILAAANPINGRYDKKKTLRQNINLSAPIMSRFDLFFVLIDEIDRQSDENIASFILKNHLKKENNLFFKNEDIKNYLNYCRNLQPSLTEESKEILLQKYILLRQESLVNNNNYKITIRNLESMVRLSEAMAKLHCDTEVKPVYVSEAFRLIKSSVLEVKKEDLVLESKEIAKKVNYKDYERITNNLIYLLKVKDNLTKEMLVDEYLKGIEGNLLSEEDYFNEKSSAELTVEFLIEKEGVLFMEGDYVFIHPNFDI